MITRAWMVSSDTDGARSKRYTSAFTFQPHLFVFLDASSLSFVLNSSEDSNIIEELDGELRVNVSRCQVRNDK